MKIKYLFILGLFMTVLFTSCISKDIDETRKMPIQKVDITKLNDGNYFGEYSYGKTTYKVDVIIENKKIIDIKVLQTRNSSYAKKAEGVIKSIIKEQRNDVDVISGATTTSKALLKAIENALSQ